MEGCPPLYVEAVVPSDTVRNIEGARYLLNVGTAGTFIVSQRDHPDVQLYLGLDFKLDCAREWIRVNTTGFTPGVALVAYFD